MRTFFPRAKRELNQSDLTLILKSYFCTCFESRDKIPNVREGFMQKAIVERAGFCVRKYLVRLGGVVLLWLEME
jgi:hypothetical protein